MGGGRKNKRSQSIFQTIMLPLLALVLAESLVLLGSLACSGLIKQLDQNARDLLDKQVENRTSYLESAMTGTWSDLSLLADTINQTTQGLVEEGTLDLELLDSNSEVCSPLLQKVMDDMISVLYSKKISGIYLIFNTHDLGGRMQEAYPNRTGIYIRDLDPASPPSYRNGDLLLERAPISLVRAMNLSTDTEWRPMFQFGSKEDSGYYDALYWAFQSAWEAEPVEDASNYCYWNAWTFQKQANQPALSYSLPLVLEDGTVYGVLGVELLNTYLQTFLPSKELFDDQKGTYFLAVDREGTGDFQPLMVTGSAREQSDWVNKRIQLDGDTFHLENGVSYYANVEYLTLYDSNTPFVGQRWALIGAVAEEDLYAFSEKIQLLLNMAILVALLSGVVGSILISRRLSKPIAGLSEEVDRAQREKGGIPQFPVTGVREIDRFSQAISSLSREVVDASTKFLRIMEMASVEMGGFELRQGEECVFVTDNFFPLFGKNGVEREGLTAQRFNTLLRELNESLTHVRQNDGSTLYTVPLSQGGIRYVRVEVTGDGVRHVGLAEDVTEATRERMRIEHERDYDLLTGLYNRRAFYQRAEALFREPEKLGHAALLMMDLDNLKTTNDRFGHDCGDQYIRQAGRCFAGGVPSGTLCARVSGDEFYLLFYGYESREDIRKVLAGLSEAIRTSIFILPSGERRHISASGGVAWYPDDSRELSELMHYADFAMYQVKQSAKGEMGDFDLGTYSRESFLIQRKREFRQLLEKQQISYHFQPIVDAASGAVFAYEALMRVKLSTLRSPEDVLQLAREEGCLGDIERLTWFRSCEDYEALEKQGMVEQNALLFVNSIASQCLSPQDCKQLVRRFGSLQPKLVIEITEAEDLDGECTRIKRETPGFSGLFALDDYGSGYNSEKNLLELAPKFIKVDISIIRDIDRDADKRQLVRNIVSYAHQRDMRIVAEGLETAEELETVLRLGVDLLQGYYLARPAAVPSAVSSAALAQISAYAQERP